MGYTKSSKVEVTNLTFKYEPGIYWTVTSAKLDIRPFMMIQNSDFGVIYARVQGNKNVNATTALPLMINFRTGEVSIYSLPG